MWSKCAWRLIGGFWAEEWHICYLFGKWPFWLLDGRRIRRVRVELGIPGRRWEMTVAWSRVVAVDKEGSGHTRGICRETDKVSWLNGSGSSLKWEEMRCQRRLVNFFIWKVKMVGWYQWLRLGQPGKPRALDRWSLDAVIYPGRENKMTVVIEVQLWENVSTGNNKFGIALFLVNIKAWDRAGTPS